MSDQQTTPCLIPKDMMDRLCRRGWAIERLGQAEGGYWFGTAEFLRGGPFEDGPDFLFSVREPTREACITKLSAMVQAERAKGKWTEIASDE
jgi:hypothetical protein